MKIRWKLPSFPTQKYNEQIHGVKEKEKISSGELPSKLHFKKLLSVIFRP